jgi:hypothetical protein
MLSNKNSAIAPKAAIRGPVLTFTGDPFKESLQDVMVYESDAIVTFGDGIITHFAASIAPRAALVERPIGQNAVGSTLHPRQAASRRGCVKTPIYAILMHGWRALYGRLH